MKRTVVWAALAACLALPPLAAQAPAAGETVFAPFVARLRAAVKDDMVKLTWADSRDATGPLFIFRSPTAVTVANVAQAELLGEVPYGAQSYIDRPPRTGTWHYYVAASNPAGERYDIMIPFSNMTHAVVAAAAAETAAQPAAAPTALDGQAATASVSPATAAAPTAPAPAEPAAPPEPPAITGITARVQGDAIEVGFAARDPQRNAILYRSANPIAKVQDLLEAVIVASAPAVPPFVDYPVPGIAYYYALIAEDALKSGTATLAAGENVTVASVEVPPGRYRIGLPGPTRETRSMPLPMISVEAFVADGSYPAAAPAQASLSPAAAKAVADLLPARAGVKTVPERKPRAFPQDLEAPTGGEEYTLRTIVQGPFAKRDWTGSVDQLARYLSLPRSAAVEARARFYLAQAYFFVGKTREALFEFLLVQSQYPSEAGDWIQAVLPALAATANS